MPIREPFLINPPRRLKARKKRKSVFSLFGGKRKKIRKNPGEEVIVVGFNPFRLKRKKKTTLGRKRRVLYSNPRTSSAASVSDGPVRRKRTRTKTRRRSVSRASTVKRTYRRVRSRTRAIAGGINVKKPMTMLAPVGAALVGVMTARKIPQIVGLQGLTKLGAQFALGLGGAYLLKKPLGTSNATVFAASVLATAVVGILSEKIGGIFADDYGYGVARMSSYNASSVPAVLDSSYGAFPSNVPGLGAFPDSDYGY